MVEALHVLFTKVEITSNAIQRWPEEMYSSILQIESGEIVGENTQLLLDHTTHTDVVAGVESVVQANGLRGIITWLRLHENVTSLRPATLHWARSICDNPTELLKPLAKEHVRHWFSKINADEAKEGFEFAREALKSVKTLPTQTTPTILTTHTKGF
jgi:hypothetical protein